MAVLSDADRLTLHTLLMQVMSNQHSVLASVTKADMRAAINAADDWRDTNAASYNNALPAAFKNNASAKQKALLLMYVVSKFYEVS